MYFKLSASQENYLLNQPETGMGYQVVEAIKTGSYTREKFLVLNSEVVIEMNTYNQRKSTHYREEKSNQQTGKEEVAKKYTSPKELV